MGSHPAWAVLGLVCGVVFEVPSSRPTTIRTDALEVRPAVTIKNMPQGKLGAKVNRTSELTGTESARVFLRSGSLGTPSLLVG